MRFLLTLVIWIVFVGGLKLYTIKRDASLPIKPSEAPDIEMASATYSVRLTPTFTVEKDPFALQTDNDAVSGIELALNGNNIVVPVNEVDRGKVLVLKNLQGVQIGQNELYLKASPPIGESMLDQGIRIQLLENDNPIANTTLWGEKGSLVLGTVNFAVSLQEKDNDH